MLCDALRAPKVAIAAVLDGAQSQRCRTRFTGHLLDRIPRQDQPMVGTLVRIFFAQQRHGGPGTSSERRKVLPFLVVASASRARVPRDA